MCHNHLIDTNNFCFGCIDVSFFFETFLAGLVARWLENLILMKTQLSAWTWSWILDLDLGVVNSDPYLEKPKATYKNRIILNKQKFLL